MEFQELLETAGAQLKVDGKAALKNQVSLLFVPASELALSKLKAAIPGQVDDAVIDMVGPKLVELLKEEIEKLLENI